MLGYVKRSIFSASLRIDMSFDIEEESYCGCCFISSTATVKAVASNSVSRLVSPTLTDNFRRVFNKKLSAPKKGSGGLKFLDYS